MKPRITWPGDGDCNGTENALLFNEVLCRCLYNLGYEVNKKGIYFAEPSLKVIKISIYINILCIR